MAVAGLSIASLAFGKLVKDSLDAVADMEQSIGGIETLFKDSADTVIKYAKIAYKTAGLNANDYMQSVTSFSASLLSALGGDTEKAAEAANKALIDMSDNANKMGSDMESIQNAYQGFAKGSFVMLDNLKLGYGGTQTEMERLLEDAQKLSGVKYDISNLADIYEAIHVIQTELDITGTTAKEASTTIAGSMTMTKTALDNLLSGAGGVAEFTDSFQLMADNITKNLLVIIPRLSEALPRIAQSIVPMIVPIFQTMIPAIIEGGAILVQGIVAGFSDIMPGIITELKKIAINIIDQAPVFFESAKVVISSFLSGLNITQQDVLNVLNNIVAGIKNALPQSINNMTAMFKNLFALTEDVFISVKANGQQFIDNLVQGIVETTPKVLAFLGDLSSKLFGVLQANAPSWVKSGMDMIYSLLQGLANNLPTLIVFVSTMALDLLKSLYAKLPDFLKFGKDIITSIVSSIVENAPNLIVTLLGSIGVLLTELSNKLPEFFVYGVAITMQLIEGFLSLASELALKGAMLINDLIVNLGKSIIDGAKILFDDAIELGEQIVNGIVKGVSNLGAKAIESVKGLGKDIIKGAKDIFDINSPSKIFTEIGENISESTGLGIDKSSKKASDSAKKMAKQTLDSAKLWIKDYQNSVDYTLQGELEAWEQLSKQYKIKSKERIEIDSNIKKIKEQFVKEQTELERNAFEQSRAWIETKSRLEQLSTKEQIEAWERVSAKYKENSTYYNEAQIQKHELTKRLAKEEFDFSSKWIETKKALGLLSSQQELEAWERVSVRYKEGTEQRTQADIKMHQLKLQQLSEQEKAEKELAEERTKISKEITDAENKYQEALNNRTEAIFNTFGVFDELKKKEELSSQVLVDNLKTQVDVMKEWASDLESLAKKGIDEGLLEELRKMGPNAYAEIDALNNMSATQLDQYSKMFGEKQALAKNAAIKELEQLRAETNIQIDSLTKQLNDKSATFKLSGEVIGQAFVDGFASKFEALKQVAGDFATTAENALSNYASGATASLIGASSNVLQSISNTTSNSNVMNNNINTSNLTELNQLVNLFNDFSHNKLVFGGF